MKTHRYAVLIKRPKAVELMGLTRAAKYAYLQQHSLEVKNHLLDWLQEKGLLNQVKSVEPNNAFNTLFFNTTNQVKQALEQNNEVEKISIDRPLHAILTWEPE